METSSTKKTKVPFVIVGKDRTIMTAAVIDRLLECITDVEPYIITVDDGSADGHNEFIKDYLTHKNVGFEVCSTEDGRRGLGAALNIGLEHAFKISDNVLLMENDWYLRKELNINKYLDILNNSKIGCISFKHLNQITNVKIYKYISNDIEFIVKHLNNNGSNSYSIEFGCQLLNKRIIDNLGWFLENQYPPIVEKGYYESYNKFSIEELGNRRIYSSNDLSLCHAQLNDENCVFYHIGMKSSQNAYWRIPKQFEYLTNDELDSQICKLFKDKV